MTKPTDILGVVLAGGLARRMGGGDKGRIMLGHQSLIDRVVARLVPQCGALVINANGDPKRFEDLGLPIVADGISGHPGPLAGVLAGMDHAADHGFTHVLSAAADTPFFPLDLSHRLSEAAGQAPIVLAATRNEDGKIIRQPVFGLWSVALREDLRQALIQGVTKIVSWTDMHGATVAEFPTTPTDPFFNINSRDDLAQAERLVSLRVHY